MIPKVGEVWGRKPYSDRDEVVLVYDASFVVSVRVGGYEPPTVWTVDEWVAHHLPVRTGEGEQDD